MVLDRQNILTIPPTVAFCLPAIMTDQHQISAGEEDSLTRALAEAILPERNSKSLSTGDSPLSLSVALSQDMDTVLQFRADEAFLRDDYDYDDEDDIATLSSVATSIYSTAPTSPFDWSVTSNINRNGSLIGREREKEELLKVIRRILGGKKERPRAEAVLMYGASGSGKTSLIQTVRRQLENDDSDHMLWISGKYEQFQQMNSGGRPYGGLAHASEQLCRGLIERYSQTGNLLDTIRKALTDQLSLDEQTVLMSVIPMIGLLWNSNAVELLEQRDLDLESMSLSSSSHSMDVIQQQQVYHHEYLRDLASPHTFRRFSALYRRLLHIVSDTIQIPIVMVLDDLQWADDASRQLLRHLAADRHLWQILLVGAVRTTEEQQQQPESVSASSTTTNSFYWPNNAIVPCQKIVFGPLLADHVSTLVARALGCTARATAPLGELIHQATEGNPLHVIEFVELLYREGMIYKNIRPQVGILSLKKNSATLQQQHENDTFGWDLERIKLRTTQLASSGLLEVLLRNKLDTLRHSTRRVLGVAALVGYRFEVRILQHLLSQPKVVEAAFLGTNEETQQLLISSAHHHSVRLQMVEYCLKEATKVGLLHMIGLPPRQHEEYQFVHDRVQEASVTNLPEETGDSLRYLMGIALMAMKEEQRDSSSSSLLFTAVNLINKARNGSFVDMENNMNTFRIAEYNLRAAVEAARQAAYAQSADYADKGLAVLGGDLWTEKAYTMSLDLANQSAHMHYSCGNVKVCMDMTDVIIAKAQTPEDSHKARRFKILYYAISSNFHEGVTFTRDCLKMMGHNVPETISKVLLARKHHKLQKALRDIRPSDIEKLPVMPERMAQWLYYILCTGGLAHSCAQDRLFALMGLEGMLLTVKHGVCIDTPHMLVGYAMLLTHLSTKRLREAYEYGKTAVKIASRHRYRKSFSRAVMSMESHIRYLCEPTKASFPHLAKCFAYGLQTGEEFYAAFSMRYRVVLALFVGMRMSDLDQ